MGQNAEGGRALVIEDDEDIAYILDYLLGREGFQVTLVPDGRLALEYIAGDQVPDIVLLDVMLPYHDGFELVQRMRENPDWQSVPVIMLTARSHERDVVRGLDAGVDDYMVKPFQPDELMARIRNQLNPRR